MMHATGKWYAAGHATLRCMTLLFGVGTLVLAAGFFLQAPWAMALWPWIGAGYYEDPGTSSIFLTSIALANAAALLWLGLSGEVGAAVGGALDLLITAAGLGGFLWRTYQQQGGTYALSGSAVCAVVVILLLGTLALASRYPPVDRRPMPLLVRCSFALFVPVLALAGILLVTGAQNIYPWWIGAETAMLYGWIFLGAAAYFLYGLLRPYWSNAVGQLLGFLAYDVVLLPPFLGHFATVPPELRLSLAIYTAVLIYSAAVACFFLFVHRETRLWGR